MERRKVELRQQLDEHSGAIATMLHGFEQERQDLRARSGGEVDALRNELLSALPLLQAEEEKLADTIESYARLRYEHLALQRRYAEEAGTLKACNVAMARSAEDIMKAAQKDERVIERRAKQQADQQIRHYRNLEAQDRVRTHAVQDCLEDVEGNNAARMVELRKGIETLKEKCSKHRQVRHFALEGLRSDLSLLRQKIKVLEDVNKQVEGHLSAVDRQRHDAHVQSMLRRVRPRRRKAKSPYQVPVVGKAKSRVREEK